MPPQPTDELFNHDQIWIRNRIGIAASVMTTTEPTRVIMCFSTSAHMSKQSVKKLKVNTTKSVSISFVIVFMVSLGGLVEKLFIGTGPERNPRLETLCLVKLVGKVSRFLTI